MFDKMVFDPSLVRTDHMKLAKTLLYGGNCFLNLLSIINLFVLQVYIQKRIGTVYSYLWKHLLQMGFVSFALLCSISRIIDKRHHWWDVLAGMLIGMLFAYITVIWHANSFKLNDLKKDSSKYAISQEDLPQTQSTVSTNLSNEDTVSVRQRHAATVSPQ